MAMRIALCCALFLGITLGYVARDAGATAAGDRAHEFSLKDLSGATVTLSGLKGKVVIVDFWASWCKPCKKELPVLDALAKKIADAKKDVVFVTINIDKDRANAEKFLQTAKIKHLTTLLDPDGAVAGQYDLPTMPTSFVIDKKGIVRHVHAGYEEGDEKALETEIEALLK